jgi:Lrp/AsnC family leucine-responsive transcriptional regulator
MLDEKDMEILKALRKNSKSSVNALAKLTGIPPATVHHRLKRLEREGVITRYTIEIDQKKAGYALSAYILITVRQTGKERLDQRFMAEKLAKYEMVEEASVLTGEADMLLKVRARSMDELNNFVLDRLRNFEGIEKTRTLMIMHSAKGN